MHLVGKISAAQTLCRWSDSARRQPLLLSSPSPSSLLLSSLPALLLLLRFCLDLIVEDLMPVWAGKHFTRADDATTIVFSPGHCGRPGVLVSASLFGPVRFLGRSSSAPLSARMQAQLDIFGGGGGTLAGGRMKRILRLSSNLVVAHRCESSESGARGARLAWVVGLSAAAAIKKGEHDLLGRWTRLGGVFGARRRQTPRASIVAGLAARGLEMILLPNFGAHCVRLAGRTGPSLRTSALRLLFAGRQTAVVRAALIPHTIPLMLQMDIW
jgi:hypothetical protein